MARALEAPQHVPRPAAVADLGRTTAGCTRRSTRPSPRPAGSRRPSPNLQSIPIRTDLGREIRSAFVAEEGHRLLSADYSQIELRILAHVSGEPKLREAFERGEDIHRATAAEVLGVDPAKLTTGQRSIAKMINFGIVYGISAFGLSENLEIPRERGAGATSTRTSRASRTCRTSSRARSSRRGGRLRHVAARPPPAGARDPRVEPPDARLRRAARGQLRHAGLERRHHQGRDDPHRPTGCARRGAARGSCCRCTTSCCSRCPDVEVSKVARARPRGDVRRLRPRPAARGRRRRRRQLGRGEVVTIG